MKERTESRAFLSWFLDNYYRLDDTEVHDCICGGQHFAPGLILISHLFIPFYCLGGHLF
jgi:hypothetical protein